MDGSRTASPHQQHSHGESWRIFFQDEGQKRGGTDNSGIMYYMYTVVKPKDFAYDSARDQKHQIIIRIPRDVFVESRYKLKIEFLIPEINIQQVSPPEGMAIGEAVAAFNNFKMEARFCKNDNYKILKQTKNLRALPRCSKLKDYVVSSEDFEDGWTRGWVPGFSERCKGFSQLLGRYGQATSATTYKLFVIPSEAHWVQVRFDFYEIGKYHYFSDSIHCAFELHLKLILFHFDSDSWGEFSRFSKYILLVGFCISCSGLISCESL